MALNILVASVPKRPSNSFILIIVSNSHISRAVTVVQVAPLMCHWQWIIIIHRDSDDLGGINSIRVQTLTISTPHSNDLQNN